MERLIHENILLMQSEENEIFKLENINNYVLYCDELKIKRKVSNMLKGMTFGYIYNPSYTYNYYIITYFLNIVLVTEYKPQITIIDLNFMSFIRRKLNDRSIEKMIKREIRRIYAEAKRQKNRIKYI